MMNSLYLASRSPRRRELLARLGVAFETLAIEVDESWDGSEPPSAHVTRLALEKVHAGQRIIGSRRQVLGADTAVVIDGRILGQPRDGAEAQDMLAQLSGRTHEVLSAVALTGGAPLAELNVSRVTFRVISAAERERYCAGGEPIGKAGAYAIQGLAAAFLIRLEGSYSGVMGLPLVETRRLLKRGGVR